MSCALWLRGGQWRWAYIRGGRYHYDPGRGDWGRQLDGGHPGVCPRQARPVPSLLCPHVDWMTIATVSRRRVVAVTRAWGSGESLDPCPPSTIPAAQPGETCSPLLPNSRIPQGGRERRPSINTVIWDYTCHTDLQSDQAMIWSNVLKVKTARCQYKCTDQIFKLALNFNCD